MPTINFRLKAECQWFNLVYPAKCRFSNVESRYWNFLKRLGAWTRPSLGWAHSPVRTSRQRRRWTGQRMRALDSAASQLERDVHAVELHRERPKCSSLVS